MPQYTVKVFNEDEEDLGSLKCGNITDASTLNITNIGIFVQELIEEDLENRSGDE